MLKNCPNLTHLVSILDAYLGRAHPEFFGPDAVRPFSPLKPYKVVHDPLWGTNRFSWRELALIDSPILQRLRHIHQTGLAYYVYPSARHSRFEHSLGVLTIASRVFDSLFERYSKTLITIVNEISGAGDTEEARIVRVLGQLKQELRLAALLHDTGHSLFSHASEKVYSEIGLLKSAAEELSDLVAKEKGIGAGEVLSFSIANTHSVEALLARAKQKVVEEDESHDLQWDISLRNVALLLVGSAPHPFLQFLGDIVSSGLDADKLDYLLRDASSAGLPLRYDLERYLYTVAVEKDYIVDQDGQLAKLYRITKAQATSVPRMVGKTRMPTYDAYRLRLPKRATNTIEQIVISKMMLFSYIYHHQKVRAAEGLLEKLLNRQVLYWRKSGMQEDDIVLKFLELDDTAVTGRVFLRSRRRDIRETSYRLNNRILPREVYRFSPAVSHAEGRLVKRLFRRLKERAKRAEILQDLDRAVGEELVKLNSRVGKSWSEAIWKTGVWVDAPKPPQVEEVELAEEFPIEEWTEAYYAHRYYLRVYAYSEHVDLASRAVRIAMKRKIGILTDEFYENCRRKRD
jgi:HD superfamily phosphohydrolase